MFVHIKFRRPDIHRSAKRYRGWYRRYMARHFAGDARYEYLMKLIPFGKPREVWDHYLSLGRPIPHPMTEQNQIRVHSTEGEAADDEYVRWYDTRKDFTWHGFESQIGRCNPPWDLTWLALLHYPQKEVIVYCPRVADALHRAGFRRLDRLGIQTRDVVRTRDSICAVLFLPPPGVSTREAKRMHARAIRDEKERAFEMRKRDRAHELR